MTDDLDAAAADDAVGKRMADLYSRVDAAVASHKPVCINRGLCCRFDKFGHRLYVTAPELAYFVRGHRHDWRPPVAGGACPYQQGGHCTAREHRPLGCRIFFCDPDAQSWQGPLYERYLAELKGIGNDAGLPYRYQEWLSALGEISPPLAPINPIDHRPLPVIQ